MVYNEIVTWTAFAILAMFLIKSTLEIFKDSKLTSAFAIPVD